MSAALTPWFPADVKPVRPGKYEVRLSESRASTRPEYMTWDGRTWYYEGERGFFQDTEWRGLASDPSVTP